MKFIKQYLNYILEMSLTKSDLDSSNLYLSTVKQKKSLDIIDFTKTKVITQSQKDVKVVLNNYINIKKVFEELTTFDKELLKRISIQEMSMTKDELEKADTYVSTVKQKSSLTDVYIDLEKVEDNIEHYKILNTSLKFYRKINKIVFTHRLSDFAEKTISKIILGICNKLKTNDLEFVLNGVNEKKIFNFIIVQDKNFKLMDGKIFYTNPVYDFKDKSQIKLNKMFSNISLDDIKTVVTPGESKNSLHINFIFNKEIEEYLNWLKQRGQTGLLINDEQPVFIVFTDNDNIIITEDINPNLRNIGLGYKLYKKLIEEVKFICSSKALSSPYAKKVWYSLLQDDDYYHILSKTEVVVVDKNVSNEELKKIYSQFKKQEFETFDEEMIKRINKA